MFRNLFFPLYVAFQTSYRIKIDKIFKNDMITLKKITLTLLEVLPISSATTSRSSAVEKMFWEYSRFNTVNGRILSITVICLYILDYFPS